MSLTVTNYHEDACSVKDSENDNYIRKLWCMTIDSSISRHGEFKAKCLNYINQSDIKMSDIYVVILNELNARLCGDVAIDWSMLDAEELASRLDYNRENDTNYTKILDACLANWIYYVLIIIGGSIWASGYNKGDMLGTVRIYSSKPSGIDNLILELVRPKNN